MRSKTVSAGISILLCIGLVNTALAQRDIETPVPWEDPWGPRPVPPQPQTSAFIVAPESVSLELEAISRTNGLDSVAAESAIEVERDVADDVPNATGLVTDERVSSMLTWVQRQLGVISGETSPPGSSQDESVQAVAQGEVVARLKVMRTTLEEMRDERVPANRFINMLVENGGYVGEYDSIVESIIIASGRPAYKLCGDSIDLSSGTEFWEGHFTKANQERLVGWSKAVGRVEVLKEGNIQTWPIGSCFYIGKGLFVTNAHVVSGLIQDPNSGAPGLQFKKEYKCFINLGDSNPNCAYKKAEAAVYGDIQVVGYVRELRPLHDIDIDVAILKVESYESLPLPKPLMLDSSVPVLREGFKEDVAVIGFPMQDKFGSLPGSVDQIFGGASANGLVSGEKRLAPGVLKNGDATRDCQTFEDETNKPRVYYHDCSTLAGSSGSPVISLDRGVVVSVHYSGVSLSEIEVCIKEGKKHDGNAAIPMWKIVYHPKLRNVLSFL